MAEMQLRSGVDATRMHVRIELWMDDKPLGYAVLDASDLENHICQLAAHRSRLLDEVPRDLDPIVVLDTITDTIWRGGDSEPDKIQGSRQKILALRHPGFGWLTFKFPRNEAARVAEWLTECAEGGSNP